MVRDSCVRPLECVDCQLDPTLKEFGSVVALEKASVEQVLRCGADLPVLVVHERFAFKDEYELFVMRVDVDTRDVE